MAKRRHEDATVPPITGTLEDAVKALLKPPPPPKNLGRPAAGRAATKRRKARFDAAHKKGMEAMARKDYGTFTEVIAEEKAIIAEHKTALGMPRKRAKKKAAKR